MTSLLGESPQIAAIRDQVARLVSHHAAAPRRLPPVLIQGETGTGKGLVAHLLHETGPRASAPFVDVNCAAIPDTLLEAELFGFERGAFTDARQAKAGLLQTAHRGTIFLDEIGLMPEALQVKLLKALEERMVRRLGSTRAEPVDAWVVAATSENLSEAIRARRFREDLYHRLAVVTLHLPPLRERGSDVLLLARHYLGRVCAEYGLPAKTLMRDAEAALTAYSWPGNIRELANVMERVALLSDTGQVSAAVLALSSEPRVATPAVRAEGVDEQTAALERARIDEALHAEGWNISRTAARLGLARNTLRYRMERHGFVESRRRHDPPPRHQPSPPSQVRWQRTRITFLQADVLAGADGGDEDHQRTRVADALAAKASSFGGRIVDVSSSSVTAAFGLNLVEDASHHAAHAALAMQHAVRTSLSPARVRIALHTGETLVGRLGDRVELDADGRRTADDVLARLLAVPGDAIVASPATGALLDRRFEVEAVAGSASGEPPSWRVRGLLSRDQSLSPFVSRDRELALLEDLLAQAEGGVGQSVLLAGDAGIGKSRLLQELRRRVRGRAGWLEGTALSFGGSMPFHPLIDLFKRAFEVHASDTDDVIVDRIDRATAGFGETFVPSAQFLRSLLSVDPGDPAVGRLDPKLRRAGIFDAVRQFLLATAARRPLVVVLEDAHWMDQATAEFLPLLVEGLADGRILLCVTQRSGFALPSGERAFGTRLTISKISAGETARIASSLLDADVLSPELQQLIDGTTEGNPLFVEEVARSLHERGLLERLGREVGLARPTGRIDLPDRVQDVILGRLERLDSSSREMLHVASVVGREFPRRVLERVMPDAQPSIDERIRALRAADLIQSVRVWPEAVDVFKHALTQEVAYHAQEESQRQALHARIGEAIEQLHADRLSEHLGVLAHHFTRGERWDKALGYLLSAAQQAERAFATREALALYDEATHVAGRRASGAGDPATQIAIHEAKARLYFVTSDFERSAAEGERILPLARLSGDRVKESEALAMIAWASTWGRNLDAAIRAARQALAVAEPAGALAVQGRAHFTIGWVRGVTGHLDESHAAIDRAVALSTAAGDPVHRSLALSTAGLLRNWAGDFTEAARLQEEGLTLARERGLLVPLLFSCFLRGLTLTGKGNYDEAFATVSEGLALAERVGDEAIHHRLLNCLGWLFADLGDLEQAEALNTTSAQIGRRRRDPGTQPNAELNLGDIFRDRGDVALAEELYDGVFRYWRHPSTSEWMRFRYSIRMFASMGELALARGDLGSARAHGAECLELATRTGSRKNLVKGWRLSGEIARVERDWDRAQGALQRALDLASALGNPVQLWKTELAIGRLMAEAGRSDAAGAAYQRAAAVMQQVRDGLRHEALRAAFEKNPDHRLVAGLIAEGRVS